MLARRHDASLHAAVAAPVLVGDEAEAFLRAWQGAEELRRCSVTREAVCLCAARTCGGGG